MQVFNVHYILTYFRTEQELWKVRSSRAVCWPNFVEHCRRIYGEPSYEEWHQSLSHDVAYTDGLRPKCYHFVSAAYRN